MVAILPSATTTVWSSLAGAPVPSISFTCTSATFGAETFTSSLTSLASLSYCCAAPAEVKTSKTNRFLIAHLKIQQDNRGLLQLPDSPVTRWLIVWLLELKLRPTHGSRPHPQFRHHRPY